MVVFSMQMKAPADNNDSRSPSHDFLIFVFLFDVRKYDLRAYLNFKN